MDHSLIKTRIDGRVDCSFCGSVYAPDKIAELFVKHSVVTCCESCAGEHLPTLLVDAIQIDWNDIDPKQQLFDYLLTTCEKLHAVANDRLEKRAPQ